LKNSSSLKYMLLYIPYNIDVYTGSSNFKRFDVRTTWNSNTKFEENSVLKLKSQTKNDVVAFLHCLVACTVAQSLLPWLDSVSISQIQSCFLSNLFLWLIFIFSKLRGLSPQANYTDIFILSLIIFKSRTVSWNGLCSKFEGPLYNVY
jgi:hypothetical protein